MTINQNLPLREWICTPTDWEEVKEIKISIQPGLIEALYIKEEESAHKEVFTYDEAVQDEYGMIKLVGAPFSLLTFGNGRKMIISRLKDSQTRPFSYIFTSAS